jgi:hypothetical protein
MYVLTSVRTNPQIGSWISTSCVYEAGNNLMYSGPSIYDRFDIRTTWVTTKILVLTYDQIFSYDPNAGQGHLSYDPHGVRNLQSEPRYALLWT